MKHIWTDRILIVMINGGFLRKSDLFSVWLVFMCVCEMCLSAVHTLMKLKKNIFTLKATQKTDQLLGNESRANFFHGGNWGT